MLPKCRNSASPGIPPFSFLPSTTPIRGCWSARRSQPSTSCQPQRQSRFASVWKEQYGGEPFVRVISPGETSAQLRDGRFLDLGEANRTNRVELFAFGDDRGVVLVGRLDNLGKGASGNAVQCMNLMLGFEESKGLAS